MTREQLEHAIRAACDVVGEHEVYVFGSQSILGQFPDVPATLKMSAEADISPRHRLDRVEYLNTIGEDSPLHQAHGFYVHGLPITEAATLPAGWEERTVAVRASETSTACALKGMTSPRASSWRSATKTASSFSRYWPRSSCLAPRSSSACGDCPFHMRRESASRDGCT